MIFIFSLWSRVELRGSISRNKYRSVTLVQDGVLCDEVGHMIVAMAGSPEQVAKRIVTINYSRVSCR